MGGRGSTAEEHAPALWAQITEAEEHVGYFYGWNVEE